MSAKNRNFLLIAAAVIAVGLLGFGVFSDSEGAEKLLVYKTPSCGCCGKWIEHMQAAGYEVEVSDIDDLTAIKNIHRIPGQIRTCHTAIVNGYAVEGHVPSEFVDRLLAEKPKVAGIGVAGMPIGSPGMEGGHFESYDVLAFNKSGEVAVFGHVEGDPGR